MSQSKVRVRYIGSNESALFSKDPEIPSIQFNRYGQLVEMDEEVFRNIVSGVYGAKLAIMLDSDFQSLGHTQEELDKFSDPRSHASATDSFKAKVAGANKLLLDIHSAASSDTGDTSQENKEE